MFEALVNSLDYFDNEGRNKLEQKLRAFMNSLNKDLQASGYVPPKSVTEAYVELVEALEDVIDFEEVNDLDEDEVLGTDDNDEDDDDSIIVDEVLDDDDEDDDFDDDGNPKGT